MTHPGESVNRDLAWSDWLTEDLAALWLALLECDEPRAVKIRRTLTTELVGRGHAIAEALKAAGVGGA